MNSLTPRPVKMLNRLAIGQVDSKIRSDLKTDEEIEVFAQALSRHTQPLSASNTVDCMDDRKILSLGDGVNDPGRLRQRVAKQLPGGLVLASTKAAVAAGAAYLRDAKSFKHAYEITGGLLVGMGYQDGGHAHCGASTFVEQSVAKPVADDIALPTVGAVLGVSMTTEPGAAKAFWANRQQVDQLLQDGFYGDWSTQWHEDYLQSQVPQNFSHLSEVHRADGVYLISQPDMGFAKNAFIEETNHEAFGVTTYTMSELADKLGGSEQERLRLRLAFADDLLNVSNQLIAPDMPAFTDAGAA